MSNKDLFVERRPQGDFAVRRANSERASAVAPTQTKAIAEARRLEPNATILASGTNRSRQPCALGSPP